VVELIADNRSLVLWFVERSPRDAELGRQAGDPVRAAIPRSEGRVRTTEGLLIVASPVARVPAHMNNHHNLLFQIEGTKEVVIGGYDNPLEQLRQVEPAAVRSASTSTGCRRS